MDDLKQFNVAESVNNVSEDTNNLEDPIMEPAKKSQIVSIVVIIGILLGLGTGFYAAQKHLLLANGEPSTMTGTTQELTSNTTIKVGNIFGSADEKTFRDQAEGVLQAGGIDGEGSHHIERGDNKSQWVYVTSSVVDLDLLAGHRVAVWGETNQGKKAGWLMDVGRLKVIELNAAPVTTNEVTQD